MARSTAEETADKSMRARAERSRGAFEGLHVLADDDPRWSLDPVEQARAACKGGAAVIQLRVKHAGDRQTIQWGRAIRDLTREHRVHFVMNDRFDLALACDADAVHLGQTDLPPDALPEAARRALAVGRSSHDLDQAIEARESRVDYVAFGPLFGTTTKQSDYTERGLEALERIVEAVSPLPVVAIGGIDAARAASVINAGASGIAVISAVAAAADPAAAARELVGRIAAARATAATMASTRAATMAATKAATKGATKAQGARSK
jgi:thiamine-phosphate pyrophosphorylase